MQRSYRTELVDYKIGTKAWYRGSFGSAKNAVPVIITGIGEKNGHIVLDCDNGHWGYLDQFQVRD